MFSKKNLHSIQDKFFSLFIIFEYIFVYFLCGVFILLEPIMNLQI